MSAWTHSAANQFSRRADQDRSIVVDAPGARQVRRTLGSRGEMRRRAERSARGLIIAHMRMRRVKKLKLDNRAIHESIRRTQVNGGDELDHPRIRPLPCRRRWRPEPGSLAMEIRRHRRHEQDVPFPTILRAAKPYSAPLDLRRKPIECGVHGHIQRAGEYRRTDLSRVRVVEASEPSRRVTLPRLHTADESSHDSTVCLPTGPGVTACNERPRTEPARHPDPGRTPDPCLPA